MRSRQRALYSLIAVSTLFWCGCRNYESGSLMHPQIKRMAVGTVENRTVEPGLGPQLQRQLREELMRDASVKLVRTKDAQTVLNTRIISFSLAGLAAAKTRTETANDRDQYQTAIYRAQVEIEVMLDIQGRATPILPWRRVVGDAIYTELPDNAEGRRDGISQAIENAARLAVASITEAW